MTISAITNRASAIIAQSNPTLTASTAALFKNFLTRAQITTSTASPYTNRSVENQYATPTRGRTTTSYHEQVSKIVAKPNSYKPTSRTLSINPDRASRTSRHENFRWPTHAATQPDRQRLTTGDTHHQDTPAGDFLTDDFATI